MILMILPALGVLLTIFSAIMGEWELWSKETAYGGMTTGLYFMALGAIVATCLAWTFPEIFPLHHHSITLLL